MREARMMDAPPMMPQGAGYPPSRRLHSSAVIQLQDAQPTGSESSSHDHPYRCPSADTTPPSAEHSPPLVLSGLAPPPARRGPLPTDYPTLHDASSHAP